MTADPAEIVARALYGAFWDKLHPDAPAHDQAMAEARALIARIVPLLDGGWQPIATAPKDGTQFIGVSEIDGQRFYAVCWFRHGHDEVRSHSPYFRPHLWRPLPAPPASPEAAQ